MAALQDLQNNLWMIVTILQGILSIAWMWLDTQVENAAAACPLCAAIVWVLSTPCHIFWGILRSVFHTVAGFFRAGPETIRDYAQHPYSVWRGVFMAYVWELAGVERGKEPPAYVTRAGGNPLPPPWAGYNPSEDFFHTLPAGAANGLKRKPTKMSSVPDSVAARMGVTKSILQQAGKETRDRLTSELSTMLTVCTFIGGFIFTTLVAGSGGVEQQGTGNKSLITLQSNLSAATTRYYGGTSTFNISSSQTNSTEMPGTSPAGVPVNWDVYGVLAGLALIMALTCVGIYARLLVLLQWSATTASLYTFIATWERAMSGNQLLFFMVLTLSYACALAACWDRYGSSAHSVFWGLLAVSILFWWFYANFWAHSMWWRDDGVIQKYSKLYHKRLLGQDVGVFSSSWDLLPQKIPNTKYTFYGLLDQHLLGKNYR